MSPPLTETESLTANDTVVTILSGEMEKVAESENEGAGSLVWTAPASSTWYVRVRIFGGTEGSFTLSLSLAE